MMLKTYPGGVKSDFIHLNHSDSVLVVVKYELETAVKTIMTDDIIYDV
jgi:hypothetical protein